MLAALFALLLAPLSLASLVLDGDNGGGGGGNDDGTGGGDDAAKGGGKGGGGFEPINSQDELDAVLEARIKAREKALRTDLTKEIKADLKREADADAAKKQGDFEKLANDRQAEIDRLNGEVAKRDRDALLARVAAKHKLPDDLAGRLVGETEDELDADAKKLAAVAAPPKAPDTEAGAGTPGGGTAPPPADAKKEAEKAAQRFLPPGAVPIPD